MTNTRIPLSRAQAGVYFQHLRDATGRTFNIGQVTRIETPFDVEQFCAAARWVISRTPALNMAIRVDDKGLYQTLIDRRDTPIAWHDLRDCIDCEQRRVDIIEALLAKPFDLANDPLFRWTLIQSDDRYVDWVQVGHHVVVDGYAGRMLAKHVAQAYSRGDTECDANISLADYRTYLAIEEAYETSTSFKNDRHYWLDLLDGVEIVAPFEAAGVQRGQSHFVRSHLVLEGLRLQSLNATSEILSSNPYQIVTAAMVLMEAMQSRQDDVVIAMPLVGRLGAGSRSMVSNASNVGHLRIRDVWSKDIETLLGEIARQQRAALRHQRYRLEDVRRDLFSDRPGAIFSRASINLMPFDYDLRYGASLSTTHNLCNGPVDGIALSIYRETNGALHLDLDGHANAFDRAQLCHYGDQLLHFVEVLSASSASDLPLASLDLLPPSHRHPLVEFNAPDHSIDDGLVPDLFERVARDAPDAIAVICGDERLDYAGLDAASNQLARYLIGLGAGPETVVGICMDRSITMVVAILSVMKSGAAYLPLDPNHPAERLCEMLVDSAALGVLCNTELKSVLGSATRTIIVDAQETAAAISAQSSAPLTNADRLSSLKSDNLAYLIYTSGSTGKPKPVGNTFRNIARLMQETNHWYHFGSNDCWALFHSIAFDFSVWEIWGALLYGGSLVVVSEEDRRSPDRFVELLHREGVTILNQTPSSFYQLTEVLGTHQQCTELSLRCIIFGGEALEPSRLAPWYSLGQSAQLVNMYGITETTVHVTYQPFDAQSISTINDSRIGVVIPDLGVHILDSHLRRVPVGVWGEMYISGAGLARGYVGRSDLTAERFVACPFGVSGERMYRTGDLGRWRADGTIEFGGRADDQVKLRGFRIEPGEIAAVLGAEKGVGQAAVVLREIAGEARLVAYVTAARDGELPGVDDLRKTLSARLPDYMIPSAFVVLEALPLTASGKLDRKALPSPQIVGSGVHEAPSTAHEALLCRLYAELTGAHQVGVQDGFFALGGHSLLAMRLVSQIREETGLEIGLRAVFSHPTVAGLASELDKAERSSLRPVERGSGRDAEGRMTLSFGQERLWALDRLDGGSSQYNIPLMVELDGALDVCALAAAIRALVMRHEPLRTVISVEAGVPVGRLLDEVEIAPLVEVHDLSISPEALQSHLDAVAGHVFDLAGGPSLYGRLLRLGADRHVLALVVHHGAADGRSLAVLFEELSALYCGEGLTDLAWTYSDHAHWQREWLVESGTLERGLSYWRAHLSGAPEVLDLPLDHTRQGDRARHAGYVPVRIDSVLGEQLSSLAGEAGVTLYSVLLGVWGLLLGRLSRQDEVVIGTPVAGRTAPGSEALIGFFVNTMALRLDLSGMPDRDELLSRVHGVVSDGLEHGDTPFEQVVDALDVARSLSQAPVFQAMFAWQSQETAALSLERMTARSLDMGLAQAKFDVTLSLAPQADGSISGALEYDADLFDVETVSGWTVMFERLVLELVKTKEKHPVALLELVGEADLAPLVEFNAPDHSIDDGLVPDLFERVARDAPDAIAVICGDERLDYAGLDAASNQLARYLIGLGAGPETVVGICMDRSITMVVAILSVMKSGAAYLPLDPNHPAERLCEMLVDSAALGVLCNTELKSVLGSATRTIIVDAQETAAAISAQSSAPLTNADRLSSLKSDNLAYLIYTSGSTGKPKPVGNSHGGLAATFVGLERAGVDFAKNDNVLALTTLSFDISVVELIYPIVSGACVTVVSTEQSKDLNSIPDLIAKHGVTVAQATPSMWRTISSNTPKLRLVLCGGEAIDADLANSLRSVGAAVNLYGPTETTIWSTSCHLYDDRIDIGSPLANEQIHILDSHLRRVPVGVWGEMYISGAGLARGYVGRSDLTAERFVACPFGVSGERMYRTGDLGRWRADGTIEFGGRADDQVKLRGFRIEPGEIAAVLGAEKGVGQAAVVLREIAGEARLVAYVTAARDGELPGVDDLRKTLSARLPDYMIPSAFVVLEALPLTASGKLDRKALPSPQIVGSGVHEAPSTAHEALLCRLYAELTGAHQVGVQDGFFALGGHSLLAMRLVSQIREETGLEIGLRAVFSHPTVAGLASELDKAEKGQLPYHPIVPLKQGGDHTPLFCVHPASGIATVYRKLAMTLTCDCPVYGLQARGLESSREKPFETIEQMAACYLAAMRLIQPVGPYRLIGWSFGGRVALEIAQLIETAGEEIEQIILLDSPVAETNHRVAAVTNEDMLKEVARDLGIVIADVALENQRERLFNALIERGDIAQTANVDILDRVVVCLTNSIKMLEAHRLQRLVSPVVYIKASDNKTADLKEKLTEITAGPTTLVPVEATHGQICSNKFSVRIADILNATLR
ncbi:non-ribosomal peptide synthetase [Labrenzia sp. THAF82]|uniref:amino acid adenylation domain-containing protein n=1 Tax=Labrenzia sp. THAF82 TaxID=2587861 RepID=UPI001563A0C9|nr:non-ribosomal peptide synthetase [Labrenzia sp. THAF82]